MNTTGFIESVAAMLTVVTPLVAVPLTIITFYLRSLREQQVSWHADLAHRLETGEASIRDLRRAIDQFERDYTTKEEWLRECMLARRTLEQLSETAVRLDTLVRAKPASRRDAAVAQAGEAGGARPANREGLGSIDGPATENGPGEDGQ